MIVAADHQHATVGMRTLEVRVFQWVAGSIDTRTFAIPDGKDAIDFLAWQKIELLGTPYGSRRLVFVNAGSKDDIVRPQEMRCLPQRRVVSTQGRAAIARNKSRRIQPGGAVALALHDWKPDQRLGPRNKHAPAFERVFFVERDSLQRIAIHPSPPFSSLVVGVFRHDVVRVYPSVDPLATVGTVTLPCQTAPGSSKSGHCLGVWAA